MCNYFFANTVAQIDKREEEAECKLIQYNVDFINLKKGFSNKHNNMLLIFDFFRDRNQSSCKKRNSRKVPCMGLVETVSCTPSAEVRRMKGGQKADLICTCVRVCL